MHLGLRCFSELLDIATPQRTLLLAKVAKFLWPDNEKDNELNHTEAGKNVDHDITVVLGDCCSVHATQHRLIFVTNFHIINNTEQLPKKHTAPRKMSDVPDISTTFISVSFLDIAIQRTLFCSAFYQP